MYFHFIENDLLSILPISLHTESTLALREFWNTHEIIRYRHWHNKHKPSFN
jgi:hypothetical protein